jgi:hypothetical protein
VTTSVQLREESFRRAEAAILEAITAPMSASDLVKKLKPQFRDEYPVRAAIWFLIGRGNLKITRTQDNVLLAKP